MSEVRIVRYVATDRPSLQGFADIELDGRFRLNGVNLLRDGTIRSAQLTPLINHRRAFINAIEIVDPDLRESLTAAIQAAIAAHLETLPPERRMRPPRPAERKPADPPANPVAKPQNAPANGKPPRLIVPPAIRTKTLSAVSLKPAPAKPLAPPARLLIGAMKGART